MAPGPWHRNRASSAIDCGAAQSAGGCISRAWTCSWASVAVGLCRLLRGLMRAASDRHRGHVFGPLAVGLNGRRYFDAQGIDGLPDRRSNRSSGLRYCDLLLASSPQVDFAMIITVLWLVASMAIELISPVPLPDYMIPGALVPPMIVGAALHWHRYWLRRRADAERRRPLTG